MHYYNDLSSFFLLRKQVLRYRVRIRIQYRSDNIHLYFTVGGAPRVLPPLYSVSNQTRSDWTQSDRMRSEQIWSDQTRPDRTGSDQDRIRSGRDGFNFTHTHSNTLRDETGRHSDISDFMLNVLPLKLFFNIKLSKLKVHFLSSTVWSFAATIRQSIICSTGNESATILITRNDWSHFRCLYSGFVALLKVN